MPQLSAVLPLKVEPHKTNSYEVARNLFRSLVKFGGTGVFETFYIVCHGGHEALLLDEFDEFRENLSIKIIDCLLYTSPSPRDQRGSRMPSSA